MRTALSEPDGRRTGPAELAPGASFELTRTVTEEMSARHLGSGSVGVLATPAMVALMEGAATLCVQPFLEQGRTTVGYIVNIRHLRPTGIGREATARATVRPPMPESKSKMRGLIIWQLPLRLCVSHGRE